MSLQTLAVVSALVALPIVAQTGIDRPGDARAVGATSTASSATDASVASCAVSLYGDQPVLDATITLPPAAAATIVLPHVLEKSGRVASTGIAPRVGRGADFTITPGSSGAMPTVQAMAINTKGTGATANGRGVVSACAAGPSVPTPTGTSRVSKPAAACVLAPDGLSASVSVPLSAFGAETRPYRGHVTLMKRGEDVSAMLADGWSPPVVVAACSSSGAGDRRGVGYDLATLKKA